MRKKGWPYQDFAAYLDALMVNAGLSTDAELARAAGIYQSYLSRYRTGDLRPGRDVLRKLAKALGVPPVNLWVASGIADPSELDMSAAPDLTVLPEELRVLLDVYHQAPAETQEYLRRHVAVLVAGIRADRGPERPAKRRTPRKRSA